MKPRKSEDDLASLRETLIEKTNFNVRLATEFSNCNWLEEKLRKAMQTQKIKPASDTECQRTPQQKGHMKDSGEVAMNMSPFINDSLKSFHMEAKDRVTSTKHQERLHDEDTTKVTYKHPLPSVLPKKTSTENAPVVKKTKLIPLPTERTNTEQVSKCVKDRINGNTYFATKTSEKERSQKEQEEEKNPPLSKQQSLTYKQVIPCSISLVDIKRKCSGIREVSACSHGSTKSQPPSGNTVSLTDSNSLNLTHCSLKADSGSTMFKEKLAQGIMTSESNSKDSVSSAIEQNPISRMQQYSAVTANDVELSEIPTTSPQSAQDDDIDAQRSPDQNFFETEDSLESNMNGDSDSEMQHTYASSHLSEKKAKSNATENKTTNTKAPIDDENQMQQAIHAETKGRMSNNPIAGIDSDDSIKLETAENKIKPRKLLSWKKSLIRMARPDATSTTPPSETEKSTAELRVSVICAVELAGSNQYIIKTNISDETPPSDYDKEQTGSVPNDTSTSNHESGMEKDSAFSKKHAGGGQPNVRSAAWSHKIFPFSSHNDERKLRNPEWVRSPPSTFFKSGIHVSPTNSRDFDIEKAKKSFFTDMLNDEDITSAGVDHATENIAKRIFDYLHGLETCLNHNQIRKLKQTVLELAQKWHNENTYRQLKPKQSLEISQLYLDSKVQLEELPSKKTNSEETQKEVKQSYKVNTSKDCPQENETDSTKERWELKKEPTMLLNLLQIQPSETHLRTTPKSPATDKRTEKMSESSLDKPSSCDDTKLNNITPATKRKHSLIESDDVQCATTSSATSYERINLSFSPISSSPCSLSRFWNPGIPEGSSMNAFPSPKEMHTSEKDGMNKRCKTSNGGEQNTFANFEGVPKNMLNSKATDNQKQLSNQQHQSASPYCPSGSHNQDPPNIYANQQQMFQHHFGRMPSNPVQFIQATQSSTTDATFPSNHHCNAQRVSNEMNSGNHQVATTRYWPNHLHNPYVKGNWVHSGASRPYFHPMNYYSQYPCTCEAHHLHPRQINQVPYVHHVGESSSLPYYHVVYGRHKEQQDTKKSQAATAEQKD